MDCLIDDSLKVVKNRMHNSCKKKQKKNTYKNVRRIIFDKEICWKGEYFVVDVCKKKKKEEEERWQFQKHWQLKQILKKIFLESLD